MSWREDVIRRFLEGRDPRFWRDDADTPQAREDAESELDRRLSQWTGRVPPRFAAATPDRLQGPAADAFEEWVESRGKRNVLFLGPVGTGKTFAAFAFLCHVHVCGVWTTAHESTVRLMDRLRPGQDESLDRWVGVDVLALDDLGGEKPSEWVSERLFALVDERWRWEKATLVTSNLPPEQLRKVVGDRTYSRLQDDAVAVTLAGSDRRRRAA